MVLGDTPRRPEGTDGHGILAAWDTLTARRSPRATCSPRRPIPPVGNQEHPESKYPLAHCCPPNSNAPCGTTDAGVRRRVSRNDSIPPCCLSATQDNSSPRKAKWLDPLAFLFSDDTRRWRQTHQGQPMKKISSHALARPGRPERHRPLPQVSNLVDWRLQKSSAGPVAATSATATRNGQGAAGSSGTHCAPRSPWASCHLKPCTTRWPAKLLLSAVPTLAPVSSLVILLEQVRRSECPAIREPTVVENGLQRDVVQPSDKGPQAAGGCHCWRSLASPP
mmetsp:Transcript_52417/g.139007  ORF Transcript_52417/g.139007 Transcript_52417/m.139007 type:complete len:279 (+) Transcript_52417:1842-2678(+)